jgi:hypothetical protein
VRVGLDGGMPMTSDREAARMVVAHRYLAGASYHKSAALYNLVHVPQKILTPRCTMRKTPPDRSQLRDYFGGMLLASAINISAFIVMLLKAFEQSSSYMPPSELVFTTARFFLFLGGVIQVLYLLPCIILVNSVNFFNNLFNDRGRGEVVKGMIGSAVVFFLISANSCFTLVPHNADDPTAIYSVLAGYLIFNIAILALFLKD